MIEINQIYHGDCLEVMKDIDDKSIDMILCDLPYGSTACKWDVIIPFEPLWEQYKRIIKDNGCIALFGSEPFSSHLRMSNIKNFRYDIIWNKKKPSNFQMMNFQPGRIHEIISIFSLSPAVYCNNKNMNYFPIKTSIVPYIRKSSFYGSKNSTLRKGHSIKELGPKLRTEKHPVSIIEFSNANIKIKCHPTEKPVVLCEYLIKTYTNKNDLVLDNCSGSGNTGIACENINRNYILIEKEKEYFDISKKRLDAYTAQGSLFQ
jgi:DNA modification methylase